MSDSVNRRSVSDLVRFHEEAIAAKGPEKKSNIGRRGSAPPKLNTDMHKMSELVKEKLPNLEEKKATWVKANVPKGSRTVTITPNPDSKATAPIKAAKVEVPPQLVDAEVESTQPQVIKAGAAKVEVPSQTVKEEATAQPERTWTKANISAGQRSIIASPQTTPPPVHKGSPTPPNTVTANKVKTLGTIVQSQRAERTATSIKSISPEKQEAYLNELTKALEKIKDNPNLKIKVIEKSPGEYEITTAERGKRRFFSRFGKSEGTVGAKNLLLQLGSGIMDTGKPELAFKYLKLFENLENHAWGKEFLSKFHDDLAIMHNVIPAFFSPSKEAQKQIIEAVKIAHNPDASEEELFKAYTVLNNSLVPGRAVQNNYYLSLSEKIKDKIGTDKLDTLEMKEVLLGRKNPSSRNLLLSAVGWTVPGEKMAKFFEVSIKELVGQKESDPESYSKSLTSLLGASIKMAGLPKKDLGEVGDPNSLINKLYQVATLASNSDEHLEAGLALGNALDQVSDQRIEAKKVEIKEGPNAIDMRAAFRAVVTRTEPDRAGLLNALTADLRLQNSQTLTNIDEREFRGLAWSKPQARDNYAPNISSVAQNFNEISETIRASILSPEIVTSKEEAGAAIEFCIELMDACIKDNNFNAAMVINSVLSTAEVNRLITTRKDEKEEVPTGLVDKKHMQMKKNAAALLTHDASYKAYREAYDKALETHEPGKAPIPFIGPMLTDLTFINDGNPNVKEGRTNLGKQELLETQLDKFRETKKQLSSESDPAARSQTKFFTAFKPDMPEPALKEGEVRNKPPSFDERAFARSLELLPRASS